MKKRIWMLCVLMAAAGVTGCGSKESVQETESAEASAETEPGEIEESREDAGEEGTEPEEATEGTSGIFSEVKDLEFDFSSGAGGWSTFLQINEDGTFHGAFHDSDMGVTGEGYPAGTMYLCEFDGRMTEPVQVDDHSYSMQIEEITYAKEPGMSEIADETKYCYEEPYGLENAQEILLYLPGTPLEGLSEEFLTWVGYYDLSQTEDTELSFYALYVKPDEYGFSSYDISWMEEEDQASGRYVILEEPSWTYYTAEGVDTEEKPLTLQLEKVKEEPNEIIDNEEWLAENGIERPGFPYTDDAYQYDVGYNMDNTPYLTLTAVDNSETITYDFTCYQYADEYLEKDYDYIDQNILYAAVQNDILYVATGHYTYAESCPHTAYITAIDLKTDQVLWRTEPMTCNARSFAVAGDYLICGYGFTQEDDYLKIVDIRNGKVMDEIPVNSAPEYIVKCGDKLLVRTYDTNYEFQINHV